MRKVSLKTKFPLITFLAPVALVGSMIFSSTGLAQESVPSDREGRHMFLVSEIWQSDQMDMEYPMQEQPGAEGRLSNQVPVDLSQLERVWQSDQMDIEYPIQVQPGADG